MRKFLSFFAVLPAMLLVNISIMAQTKINIEVNGHKLTATLEDNSSAKALAALLEKGPVTVDANEYGGFEMVGPLTSSLPRNDRQITTKPGDIILYQGSNICFYFGVNSWNFTRLGSIDNASFLDLRSIYGASAGTARFILSSDNATAVRGLGQDRNAEIIAIHDLNGTKINHYDTTRLDKGVYVVTLRNPDGGTEHRKIIIG